MSEPKETSIVSDHVFNDHHHVEREEWRNKSKTLELLALGPDIQFDPHSRAAKKVLRKIDMRITPLIFAMYLLMLAVSIFFFPALRPVSSLISTVGQE